MAPLETIEIKKYNSYIELVFSQKWKYISTIRIFVQSFLDICLDNTSKADRISLAVSELAENAIKYSTRDNNAKNLRMVLKYIENNNKISVLFQNYTTRENIDILCSELADMKTMNPYEYYLKKVKEISSRKDGKSMLGLARIRYESECELELEYDDTLITLKAEFAG